MGNLATAASADDDQKEKLFAKINSTSEDNDVKLILHLADTKLFVSETFFPLSVIKLLEKFFNDLTYQKSNLNIM